MSLLKKLRTMVDNAINSTENQTDESNLNTEKTTETVENNMDELSEEARQLKELQKKYDELNDKYTRLFSDFDNFRRRTIKERADLLRSAGEEVLKEMLPVWDDFDRAKKAMQSSSDVESEKKGLDLIYNKFTDTLRRKGIEEMKCIGEAFNPDLHEAITEIAAPTEDMKGKIIDVVEKGYFMNGKILKYAKVIVGK